MKKINFLKTKFQDYVACREMGIIKYVHFKKSGMFDYDIKESLNFLYERLFL
jgi:hypothetical protein